MSDVKDRIRKLLALAGNNPNEHEAESAMRAALKLMAKNGLSAADFNPKDHKVGEIHIEGRGRPWERVVVSAIANLYFCDYLSMRLGKNKVRHMLIGTEENTAVASDIANWVTSSIRRAGRKGGTTAYFNSFCAGASIRISARVAKLMADAKAGKVEAEGTGKALVLVDAYDAATSANQDYIGQHYKPKKARSLTIGGSDSKAVQDGFAYADSVGLNRQMTKDTALGALLGR